MSELKNDWKNTGVGLGHAFRDLGKSVIKSAKVGADKAEEWAYKDDKPQAETKTAQGNSTPKSDTNALKEDWKSTGSSLGHAFQDLGKTMIKSAKTGADKADEWASSKPHEKQDSNK